LGTYAVQYATPLAFTPAVKTLGVFELQQRLSFAVTSLLLEVCAGALSPVMPNECARRECDPLTGLLQPPANVHIIAGFSKLWIETLNLFEGVAVKSHVAAGDVFCQLIAF
jgi:hypothetical protein